MYLRNVKTSDAHDLYMIYSNPNVTYPAGFKPVTSTLEMDDVILTLYKNKDQMIVVDNHVIGVIGIDSLKNNIVMLGFLLNERFWHKGYGTKACLLYMQQLKDKGYKTLYADCFTNNIASQKLLKKIGFTYINDYLRSFSGYSQPQPCHLYKKELT